MATALRPRSRPLEYLPGIRNNLRAMTDVGVVDAYLMGNELAFTELVERYQTRLINFVYRSIGDRTQAEDIVQETFVRVARHIPKFDQRRKFATWIYTIASNLSKNELRNRSRNVVVGTFTDLQGDREEWFHPADERNAPDKMHHKRHLRGLVMICIQRLPEHHRTVFVLREIEDKSYEEIAEIEGCRIGTVKSRLNRARTAFAAIIEPHLD